LTAEVVKFKIIFCKYQLEESKLGYDRKLENVNVDREIESFVYTSISMRRFHHVMRFRLVLHLISS